MTKESDTVNEAKAVAQLAEREFKFLKCDECKKRTSHYRAKVETDAPFRCLECNAMNVASLPPPPPPPPPPDPVRESPGLPTAPVPAPNEGPERIGPDMTRRDRVEVVRLALGGVVQLVNALSWTGQDLQRVLPELAMIASKSVTLPFMPVLEKPEPDIEPDSSSET